MGRTYLKSLYMIADSRNFSELKQPDGNEFDYGDQNKANNAMYSNMQADAVILHLMRNLNDRDKVILAYQLLRESGYNLNHADCAKTLCITRERYMVLLKDVKLRAGKILSSSME